MEIIFTDMLSYVIACGCVLLTVIYCACCQRKRSKKDTKGFKMTDTTDLKSSTEVGESDPTSPKSTNLDTNSCSKPTDIVDSTNKADINDNTTKSALSKKGMSSDEITRSSSVKRTVSKRSRADRSGKLFKLGTMATEMDTDKGQMDNIRSDSIENVNEAALVDELMASETENDSKLLTDDNIVTTPLECASNDSEIYSNSDINSDSKQSCKNMKVYTLITDTYANKTKVRDDKDELKGSGIEVGVSDDLNKLSNVSSTPLNAIPIASVEANEDDIHLASTPKKDSPVRFTNFDVGIGDLNSTSSPQIDAPIVSFEEDISDTVSNFSDDNAVDSDSADNENSETDGPDHAHLKDKEIQSLKREILELKDVVDRIKSDKERLKEWTDLLEVELEAQIEARENGEEANDKLKKNNKKLKIQIKQLEKQNGLLMAQLKSKDACITTLSNIHMKDTSDSHDDSISSPSESSVDTISSPSESDNSYINESDIPVEGVQTEVVDNICHGDSIINAVEDQTGLHLCTESKASVNAIENKELFSPFDRPVEQVSVESAYHETFAGDLNEISVTSTVTSDEYKSIASETSVANDNDDITRKKNKVHATDIDDNKPVGDIIHGHHSRHVQFSETPIVISSQMSADEANIASHNNDNEHTINSSEEDTVFKENNTGDNHSPSVTISKTETDVIYEEPPRKQRISSSETSEVRVRPPSILDKRISSLDNYLDSNDAEDDIDLDDLIDMNLGKEPSLVNLLHRKSMMFTGIEEVRAKFGGDVEDTDESSNPAADNSNSNQHGPLKEHSTTEQELSEDQLDITERKRMWETKIKSKRLGHDEASKQKVTCKRSESVKKSRQMWEEKRAKTASAQDNESVSDNSDISSDALANIQQTKLLWEDLTAGGSNVSSTLRSPSGEGTTEQEPSPGTTRNKLNLWEGMLSGDQKPSGIARRFSIDGEVIQETRKKWQHMMQGTEEENPDKPQKLVDILSDETLEKELESASVCVDVVNESISSVSSTRSKWEQLFAQEDDINDKSSSIKGRSSRSNTFSGEDDADKNIYETERQRRRTSSLTECNVLQVDGAGSNIEESEA